MAEGINAKAFTYGQDVYFKNGNYNPSSKDGKSLLAHELTHTQQQKGAEVGRMVQRQAVEKHRGGESAWSREKKYEIALALSDLDPGKVTGFDEFKPGGFRYNPNKAYNEVIKQRKAGNKEATEERLITAYKGHYFDLGTTSGRIMYTQKMKAKGADYNPPEELLIQQMIEKKGDKQALMDAQKGLAYSVKIISALQKKINASASPEEKQKLQAKKLKIELATKNAIRVIEEEKKKQDEKNGIKNAEDKPVYEASFVTAIPYLITALATLFVVSVTLAVLLTIVVQAIYKVWEETGVEEDVDIDNIDISDVLPDNVTLPKDDKKPKPGEGDKPVPVVPIPGVEEDKKKEDDCTPKPIGYHLGGDPYHDMVADADPPNIVKGTDWKVKNKSFDAYTGKPREELWEIKTAQYKTFNTFVKKMELEKVVKDAEVENKKARECGFHYVLDVTDELLYNDLKKNQNIIRDDINVKLSEKFKR
jgi:hypothetical protein